MRARRQNGLVGAVAPFLLALLSRAELENERWQLDSRRAWLRKEIDHDASQSCRPYPGKKVVLAAVDHDFVDFFDNWLVHATKFLTDKEKVVAVAENPQALPALKKVKKAHPKVNFDILLLAEGEVDRQSQGPSQPSAVATVSFLDEDLATTPYGTKGYNDLMHNRPGHLLGFLNQGCTVLFVDVDTVWLRNPLKDIADAGSHELYVIDDGHQKTGLRGPQPYWGTTISTLSKCELLLPNFCGGFMYVHPTHRMQVFVREWIEQGRTYVNEGNQRAFNEMICKHFKDKQVTRTFGPGKMGMSYDDNGLVKEMDTSSASTYGIKEGYRIVTVGDANYSKKSLVDAEESGVKYEVTFQARTASFGVLPFDKYPPGPVAESQLLASIPGQQLPTMIHANWLAGHQAKMLFMKKMGHWNTSYLEGP